MNKKLGFISLLGTALLFGSTGIWIRILSTHLTVYQQIMLRNAAGVVVSLLVILLNGRLASLKNKNLPIAALLALSVTVPLTILFNAIAILHLKISVATFMFYAGEILLSYLFGVLIFKERMTRLKIVSLLIAFVGLSCFLYPFSWTLINWSILWGLAAGGVGAVANIFRKSLSQTIDRLVLVLLGLMGGVVLSGILLVTSREVTPFTLQLPGYIWVVGIGFGILLVVSNFWMMTGFKNFDLGLGGLVLSAELFFATIFGFLFLHETPLPNELIGGTLIFIAVLLSNEGFLKHRFTPKTSR